MSTRQVKFPEQEVLKAKIRAFVESRPDLDLSTISRQVYAFLELLKDVYRELEREMVKARYDLNTQMLVKEFATATQTMALTLGVITPKLYDPPRSETYDWNVPFSITGPFFKDIDNFVTSCKAAIEDGKFDNAWIPDLSGFNAGLLISWENRKKIKHLDFYVPIDELRLGEILNFPALYCFLVFKHFEKGDDIMARNTDKPEDAEPGIVNTHEEVALQSFRIILDKPTYGPSENRTRDHEANIRRYFPDGGPPHKTMDVSTDEARAALLDAIRPHPAGRDRIAHVLQACARFPYAENVPRPPA